MKTNKQTKLFAWQKKAKITEICEKCGRNTIGFGNTVEHIIPVHLLEQLGVMEGIYEDEENFAIYCYACNKFKSGRLDIAHPKTIYLLKKYINKL